MQVSEILDRAADAIETYGHYQGGSIGSMAIGFCVVGAIDHVTGEDMALANGAIRQFGGCYLPHQFDTSIGWFSDNSPTQVVLDLLRSAAKAERTKEEATDAGASQ